MKTITISPRCIVRDAMAADGIAATLSGRTEVLGVSLEDALLRMIPTAARIVASDICGCVVHADDDADTVTVSVPECCGEDIAGRFGTATMWTVLRICLVAFDGPGASRCEELARAQCEAIRGDALNGLGGLALNY